MVHKVFGNDLWWRHAGMGGGGTSDLDRRRRATVRPVKTGHGWGSTVAGILLLAASTVPAPAAAQRASTGGVQLLVRPRVGDTLQLLVEQAVHVSGRRVEGTQSTVPPVLQGKRGASPAPDYGPRAGRANTRVSHVHLFAHSLVAASDLTGTTLLATTDSIAMWTGATGDAVRPVHLPVQGDSRHVRVTVTPDGAMRLQDPASADATLGATLASVPGLLPAGPVRVGSEWQRDMLLPSLPLGSYRASGVVQARLRLDSLSRGGRHAYIAIVGVLRRDGAARELPPGTRVITAGTLRGTMVVDRRRAWITDARTVMDVQSEVAPGPAGAGRPMLLDIRIEQQVRVR
ncbi:MAG: hypothetical protein ACK5Y5_09325 [Gemmatimonas sp.]|uniref:hypothetical protein n=1 Tax=Gemmatimonas sp. TaxID=1962908 RepID=UPI00391A5069